MRPDTGRSQRNQGQTPDTGRSGIGDLLPARFAFRPNGCGTGEICGPMAGQAQRNNPLAELLRGNGVLDTHQPGNQNCTISRCSEDGLQARAIRARNRITVGRTRRLGQVPSPEIEIQEGEKAGGMTADAKCPGPLRGNCARPAAMAVLCHHRERLPKRLLWNQVPRGTWQEKSPAFAGLLHVPRGTPVRDAAASRRGATSRCWLRAPAPRSSSRATG